MYRTTRIVFCGIGVGIVVITAWMWSRGATITIPLQLVGGLLVIGLGVWAHKWALPDRATLRLARGTVVHVAGYPVALLQDVAVETHVGTWALIQCAVDARGGCDPRASR